MLVSFLVAVGLFSILSPITSAQNPSPYWVNFYGNGLSLSVGNVVTAFDPQGVICGRFIVTTPGVYGFMPAYGDDPFTSTDEGAVPGDTIVFKIDGCEAAVTGSRVWTSNQAIQNVNLGSVVDTSLTCGINCSTTRTSFSSSISSLVSADMDMDNLSDFVFLDNGVLAVSYGHPDGGVSNPSYYSALGSASLAVAYVNGDTLLDVVARSAGGIVVLLNAGSRGFNGPMLTGFPESRVSRSSAKVADDSLGLAVGFFNGDAYIDVVAAPDVLGLGVGDGTFVSTQLPFSFRLVATADFDKDEFDDLVVMTTDSVKILINSGSAVFSESSGLSLASDTIDQACLVAGQDFNGDGNVDCAVETATVSPDEILFGHGKSRIILMDGTGAILSSPVQQVFGLPNGLVINDFNGDNKLDLTVALGLISELEPLLGNGNGAFSKGTKSYPLGPTISTVQSTIPVVPADVNRDGNIDYISGGTNTGLILSVSDLPRDSILPEEMVVTAYGGYDVSSVNPRERVISRGCRTVASSAYWRVDIDHDAVRDTRIFDYNLVKGEYRFVIRTTPLVLPGGHFTMDIRVDGSQQVKPFLEYTFPIFRSASLESTDSVVFYYTQETTPSMNPPNGKRTQTTRQPAFQWGRLVDSAHSTKYQIQLSTDYALSSTLYSDSTLTKPQFVPAAPLDTGKVYYWRARSYSGTTWSPWTRTMAAYIGTGCGIGVTGNVNMAGIVDLADLSALVSYLTGGGYVLPCVPEANVNNSGIVDLADLSALVSYLTGGGYVLPSCP